MLTENELEELTNDFLNDMIGVEEVDYHGRKAEQVKELGVMAERGGVDSVSGEDVLES